MKEVDTMTDAEKQESAHVLFSHINRMRDQGFMVAVQIGDPSNGSTASSGPVVGFKKSFRASRPRRA